MSRNLRPVVYHDLKPRPIVRDYQKFEYLSALQKDVIAMPGMLNDLGQKGWELVGIDPANRVYVFKRPLP